MTIGGSYMLHQLMKKYGFNGTMQLIWTGDHLDPDLRDVVDTLDDMEETELRTLDFRLTQVEVFIERTKCKGGSADGAHLLDLQTFLRTKTELGALSHDLDKLAFQVDSISTQGNPEAKDKKKRLSTRLVKMMATTDALMKECGVTM
eukprot:CAMPEP_0118716572 /NCGR_PEP_ID=MMETSP0800-20121206/27574_1 /TAXON_ID=210618 ORGANISM="Striatella unipunctata, Strain CCMP2910" /NCGR_SAMPLE_ID=MMETSP0800 /ASSEMBLY_ACC=CAM_ASM_000638 /LENGTH=146 /DNA_ID=CAMNT_0006623005 /DNA_START=197 /DNA_END=637 /DNA_ORIENTATION=+